MAKYIIELEDMYVRNGSVGSQGAPERLYRVKGFNSLVFDETGLKKLQKVSEEATRNPVEDRERIKYLEEQVKRLRELCDINYQAGRESVFNEFIDLFADRLHDDHSCKSDCGENTCCGKRSNTNDAVNACRAEKEKREIFRHFYGEDMFPNGPSMFDLFESFI